jgi:hypothetical protein
MTGALAAIINSEASPSEIFPHWLFTALTPRGEANELLRLELEPERIANPIGLGVRFLNEEAFAENI